MSRRRFNPSKGVPEKPYPFPELLEPGEWDITETPSPMGYMGFASRGKRHMTVPLADDARGSAVRLHELSHVKWSPDVVPQIEGLDQIFILANEDYRVNWLLRENIPEFNDELRWAMADDQDSVNKTVEALTLQKRYGDIAAMRIASSGTGSAAQMDMALRRVYDETLEPNVYDTIINSVDVAREILKTGCNSFEATKIAAWKMQEILDDLLNSKKDPELSEYDQLIEDGLKTLEYSMAGDVDELLEAVKKKDWDKAAKIAKGGSGEPEASSEKGRWGKLHPSRKPFALRLRERRVSRHKRSDKYGSVPRQIHRWYTDQRIFSRRFRYFGGAVLIDQSGSMSMSPEEVGLIVTASPTVVVAAYSGRGHIGFLRVLAQKGMRVADKDLYIQDAGGNIVDGPSLRWLAEQTEPRIWVSDGMVTGVDDRFAANLLKDAAKVCRDHRIIRVPTVGAAIALLESLR